jgi:hypothetical protein
MNSISAISASFAMYGMQPLDAPPANQSGDKAADVGPAAELLLSSLNLQGQMVTTLLSSLAPATLGRSLDALA